MDTYRAVTLKDYRYKWDPNAPIFTLSKMNTGDYTANCVNQGYLKRESLRITTVV